MNSTAWTVGDVLWPSVRDPTSARSAALSGYWAAVLVAGGNAMFVALSAVGVDLVGPRRLDGATFTTIVLFAGIGWGIQRLSRVAATLGLACYLSERAYSAAIHGPSGTLSAIAIALFFLHGVRGTFAYQSLQRNRA